MSNLEAGQAAPDFSLPSYTGEMVRLSEQRGKYVVLFFYPKDDTPGCTKEAGAFRDLNAEFASAGAVVYGISRDSIASHQKFANKYGLNMPLLADTESVVCEAYDVLKEKNNFGKVSVGIERTTFIVDPQGNIAKVFPKVKVEGHAEAVLETIHSLSGD